MRYRVMWSPDAESELELLAKSSGDPEQLADCSRRIDRHLTRHPMQYGESREEDLRIAFDGPLAILFEVFKVERTVVVYRVWTY